MVLLQTLIYLRLATYGYERQSLLVGISSRRLGTRAMRFISYSKLINCYMRPQFFATELLHLPVNFLNA